MNKDFTVRRYEDLLEALLERGFVFHGLLRFWERELHRLNRHRLHGYEGDKKIIVLRQDVDRLPGNSLAFARIQKEVGIRSTFYFRSVPQSFNPNVIEEIAGMGHEIGYHYEDLVLARQKIKVKRQKYYSMEHGAGGRESVAQSPERKAQTVKESIQEYNEQRETSNEKHLVEAGIESFCRNLEGLRKYADVRTICMHGSPMSRWDSRLLWKYYDYRDFGIELEPYFDLNMESMLYLTDTGRRWNGTRVSIRDKAEGPPSSRLRRTKQGAGIGDDKDKRQKEKDKSKKDKVKRQKEDLQNNEGPFKNWVVKPIPESLMNMTQESMEFQARYNYRSTNDIIRAAEKGDLPERIMITFHPQRWTDKPFPWVKELVWQNTKNVAKYFLIKIRK